MADGAAHREVGFGEAISLFFKNYVKFHGRSSRGAYWWTFLAMFLVSCVLAVLDTALFSMRPGEPGVLGSLFTLAILLPSVALGVRRLHDIDMSGWWMLVGLVPLAGFILLIIFFCQAGKRADTRFGGPDVEAGR